MEQEIAANWTVILLAALVGVLAILGMFALSWFISSRRPSQRKLIPYECGILPGPFHFSQISIRYYIFAILFLVFDVEAVFLFPWAVVFLGNKVAFYAMLIFLAMLFFAVIYAWRKGVLEWQRSP